MFRWNILAPSSEWKCNRSKEPAWSKRLARYDQLSTIRWSRLAIDSLKTNHKRRRGEGDASGSPVFWSVTPCRTTCWFIPWLRPSSSTLKIEAVCSCETSVSFYQNVWCPLTGEETLKVKPLLVVDMLHVPFLLPSKSDTCRSWGSHSGCYEGFHLPLATGCHAAFLLGLFFNSEDASAMFLRNVG
jgi:hypothetical protein